MYKCNDCHHFFKYPATMREELYPEGYEVCPRCGSNDIEYALTVVECAECGALYLDNDVPMDIIDYEDGTVELVEMCDKCKCIEFIEREME